MMLKILLSAFCEFSENPKSNLDIKSFESVTLKVKQGENIVSSLL